MHSQHFFFIYFTGPFLCVQFRCSPCVFLRVLWFPPYVQTCISCRFGYGSVVSPCVGAVFVLYPPSPVHVTSEKVTSDMSGGRGGGCKVGLAPASCDPRQIRYLEDGWMNRLQLSILKHCFGFLVQFPAPNDQKPKLCFFPVLSNRQMIKGALECVDFPYLL